MSKTVLDVNIITSQLGIKGDSTLLNKSEDVTIDKFHGQYDFLSNFHPATVLFEGLYYANSEAAFQAAKALDVGTRKFFVNMPPNLAKSEGRRLVLRKDWEQVKDKVMEDIVRDKFTRNKVLGRQLIATGDTELIEGNWWRDTYWGVCDGKGLNKLGKILMKVRSELSS